MASQTLRRMLGTPRVPRPHFENHFCIAMLQKIHSILLIFVFSPPSHNQVIDFINRYLSTSKSIWGNIDFSNRFHCQSEEAKSVTLSAIWSVRSNVPSFLEHTYRATG